MTRSLFSILTLFLIYSISHISGIQSHFNIAFDHSTLLILFGLLVIEELIDSVSKLDLLLMELSTLFCLLNEFLLVVNSLSHISRLLIYIIPFELDLLVLLYSIIYCCLIFLSFYQSASSLHIHIHIQIHIHIHIHIFI